MSDEEFREFNLDGKHLAFLVISGIGVAVVVFLCGVLVGRGVRAPRVATADLAAAALDDGPLGVESSLDAASTGGDGGSRVAGTELGRSDRSSAPRGEALPSPDSEPVAPSSPEPLAPRAAPPVSAAPAAKAAPPPPATVPPGGGQWVVQVVSGTSRSSAESVAARLKSKGYGAFISEYPQGAQQYRVRIGMFAKKSEARAVATRLEKEGKYKGLWVTTR